MEVTIRRRVMNNAKELLKVGLFMGDQGILIHEAILTLTKEVQALDEVIKLKEKQSEEVKAVEDEGKEKRAK